MIKVTNRWLIVVGGMLAGVLSGCATAPACRIENGEIVVDSPFALEIGSTEYAKALLGLDKKTHFMGRVGDLAVEVAYAEPRYAKRGEKYEIVCKGAVVVNIVQSPIITKGKAKK